MNKICGKEDVQMSKDLECKCGNNTASDGFVPCDDKGNEIEPTVDSNWDGKYVCQRCGAIHTIED